MKTFKQFVKEDGAAVAGAPATNVGSGNIAGAGVGPQGEPGVSPSRMPANKKFKKNTVPNTPPTPVMGSMERRKPPQV